MTTTPETMTSTGQLAGRDGTITAERDRGAGRAVLSTAVYAVVQLAQALAVVVVVWLVVLLFVHLQTVAFVLAGVLLAAVAVSLFVGDRRLRR